MLNKIQNTIIPRIESLENESKVNKGDIQGLKSQVSTNTYDINLIKNNLKQLTEDISLIKTGQNVIIDKLNTLFVFLSQNKSQQPISHQPKKTTPDQHQLKIATKNAGGVENNIGYINELIKNNRIVCLQETWAENDVSESIFLANKSIYSKPAIRNHDVGRASGGMAFVFDENLKCKCDFPTERIGILKINKLKFNS